MKKLCILIIGKLCLLVSAKVSRNSKHEEVQMRISSYFLIETGHEYIQNVCQKVMGNSISFKKRNMICGKDIMEILHFSMDIFMLNNVKSSQSIWTSVRGRNTIDNRRLGITQAQSCSILVAYTETVQ